MTITLNVQDQLSQKYVLAQGLNQRPQDYKYLLSIHCMLPKATDTVKVIWRLQLYYECRALFQAQEGTRVEPMTLCKLVG